MKKILSLILYFSLLGATSYKTEQFEEACIGEGCKILAELYISPLFVEQDARRLQEALLLQGHDEALRRSIRELQESLEKLKIASFKPTKNPHQELLQSALATHDKMMEELQETTLEPELSPVAELAQNPELIALRAQELEEQILLTPWQKDKARCGATGRALIQTLAKDSIPNMHDLKKGVPALLAEIEKNHGDKDSWVYYGDSARFDHVFVIVKFKNGRYRFLQSFVNRYSLLADLAKEKSLTLAELKTTLEKIRAIDEGRSWTPHLGSLFEEVFHTPIPSPVIEDYNREEPDFAFKAVKLL